MCAKFEHYFHTSMIVTPLRRPAGTPALEQETQAVKSEDPVRLWELGQAHEVRPPQTPAALAGTKVPRGAGKDSTVAWHSFLAIQFHQGHM